MVQSRSNGCHNITVADVEEAESEYMEFPVKINLKYTTPEDFMKIIISHDENRKSDKDFRYCEGYNRHEIKS